MQGSNMAGEPDAVVDFIIAQIDAGDALPGRAIDEKEMMQVCGVSQTQVHDALIRLEADGLVQRDPRKGTVIFQPTVAEFLTILEVHANLESFAAGLAAQRITDTLKAELLSVVGACGTHAAEYGNTDPAGYYQLNTRFHETIAQAARNDLLMQMIKTNARKLTAYYRMRYRHPGASQSSAKDHVAIADLIIGSKPEAAAAAMQEHFNYDRETVMDLIASAD